MKVSITIPEFNNDGTSNYDVIQKTVVSMSREFGGCTVTDGMGYWTNEEGKLEVDSVHILTSYNRTWNLDYVKDTLRDFSFTVLRGTDQKAVFYTVENEGYTAKDP